MTPTSQIQRSPNGNRYELNGRELKHGDLLTVLINDRDVGAVWVETHISSVGGWHLSGLPHIHISGLFAAILRERERVRTRDDEYATDPVGISNKQSFVNKVSQIETPRKKER